MLEPALRLAAFTCELTVAHRLLGNNKCQPRARFQLELSHALVRIRLAAFTWEIFLGISLLGSRKQCPTFWNVQMSSLINIYDVYVDVCRSHPFDATHYLHEIGHSRHPHAPWAKKYAKKLKDEKYACFVFCAFPAAAKLRIPRGRSPRCAGRHRFNFV